MKKICNIFVLTFLIIFALSCASRAEDIDTIMDKFYDGLADIIERNMDSPDRCVREINDYYRVGIHIADVTSLLDENSLLDIEALRRAFTLYLPNTN